jgi:hypothetical protein
MGWRNWAILAYSLSLLSEIKILLGFHPNTIRARFAPLSPASGFPVSSVPSFHHPMWIELHPSGVNSKPGPLGTDSLFMRSDGEHLVPLNRLLDNIAFALQCPQCVNTLIVACNFLAPCLCIVVYLISWNLHRYTTPLAIITKIARSDPSGKFPGLLNRCGAQHAQCAV